METKLTKAQIEAWLAFEEPEFAIEVFRRKHEISPDSDNLYRTFNTLVNEGKLRRQRRGWYRKVDVIEPIRWWNGDEQEAVKFLWPCSHDEVEYSSFGFDDNIEIFPGDSIIIAGQSNWGKTTLALNLLVDNLHLFEGARLMVNEFKPQRFRNRIKQFTWVDFWDNDKPKFEVLPVTENHADYIKPNYLNVIDWIHIKGEFWDIATITQDIQMQLRQGIAIIVVQKTAGKPLGIGGDWGKFFPAVYLIIDPPGKLSVVKVKSAPRGAITPENKVFAFDIIERGSKFHNIREVKTCPACKGRRYVFDKECQKCYAKGFIEAT